MANMSDEEYLDSLLNAVITEEEKEKERINVDTEDFFKQELADMTDNLDEDVFAEWGGQPLTTSKEQPQTTTSMEDNTPAKIEEPVDTTSVSQEMPVTEEPQELLKPEPESIQPEPTAEEIAEPETEDQDFLDSLDKLFTGEESSESLDSIGEPAEEPLQEAVSESDIAANAFFESESIDEQPENDELQETDIPETEELTEAPKKQPNKVLSWLFGIGGEDEPEFTEEELLQQEEAEKLKQEEKARKKQEKEEQSKEKKEENKVKKEQKKKEKEEQAKKKAAKKQEEKEKRAREDNPNSRIRVPKQGIILVFTIAIAFILAVALGGNMLTDSLDIKEANSSFAKKKYQEAYDKLVGKTLKGEDKRLYDQVSAIMYIQHAQDSYTNFMKMNSYPQACDALIKGVGKYYENNAKAEELGVLEETTTIYQTIIKELKETFGISEKQARNLVGQRQDNQEEYTVQIYSLIESLTFEPTN